MGRFRHWLYVKKPKNINIFFVSRFWDLDKNKEDEQIHRELDEKM